MDLQRIEDISLDRPRHERRERHDEGHGRSHAHRGLDLGGYAQEGADAEELSQHDVVDEDGSDDDCKVCYLLHDYFLANLLNTTIRYPSTRNPPGASTNTSGM